MIERDPIERIRENERRLLILTLALAIGCTLLGFCIGMAVNT